MMVTHLEIYLHSAADACEAAFAARNADHNFTVWGKYTETTKHNFRGDRE